MNAVVIYEALGKAAISAGENATMPPEFSWVDTVGKNWGAAGVVLFLFGLSTWRLSAWLGPILKGWIESRNALVEEMAATQASNSERLDRIDVRIDSIDRRITRISGVIHRNCGRNEEPDSDTELGSGSGDIHDDGKHGRKSGERN